MAESNYIARGLSALEKVLEQEKDSGTKALFLEPETVMALGKLPMQIQQWADEISTQDGTPAAVSPTVGKGSETSAVSPDQSTERVDGDSLSGNESEEDVILPEGENNREKLISLFKMAKADESMKQMESLFDTLVFATGNPEAEVAFVGEAPGAEEEKAKKPFVGPAGQKLDGLIKAMGLKREDVYISNIVKYRPKKDNGRFQGSSNRQPTIEEIAASVKYVKAELRVVKPKAVVALGRTAAEGLLGLSGSLKGLRNQWHEIDGFPVMVTYHPSYLLRVEKNGIPEESRIAKRMVWEDMLMVMEKAELPVSDKQRAYYAG